jgi:16S rRNA (uracil1498-N3)-methyltransferase
MARYRSFLFPEAILKENTIVLDGRESHHLARVFRAKEGETIEVLDGKGSHYIGTIQSVSAKAVSVRVDSVKTVPVTKPRVLLLQSESKAKSMDIVLRMATEIGVSAVQPVFTEQGEHQQRKKDKRLLGMIEACKQCGLSHLPELRETCHLRDWLQSNAQKDKTVRLVASLEKESRSLLNVLEGFSDPLEEVIIAVGPAGDFSSAEYKLLRDSGFEAVRLGANVLRVETAAAYTLSVVDQAVRGRVGW